MWGNHKHIHKGCSKSPGNMAVFDLLFERTILKEYVLTSLQDFFDLGASESLSFTDYIISNQLVYSQYNIVITSIKYVVIQILQFVVLLLPIWMVLEPRRYARSLPLLVRMHFRGLPQLPLFPKQQKQTRAKSNRQV